MECLLGGRSGSFASGRIIRETEFRFQVRAQTEFGHEVTFPNTEPEYPVLWAGYKTRGPTPPWGELVKVL
jgi:hypothetical protein